MYCSRRQRQDLRVRGVFRMHESEHDSTSQQIMDCDSVIR
jgi:hypothetical protein